MERSKDRKLGFMEATFASFLVYLRVMFGVLYYGTELVVEVWTLSSWFWSLVLLPEMECPA